MKKVWMIVALMAVGLMASSVFADVQNIRLSGDVRVRGYYYNIAPLDDAAFIAQRTRVTCEADLEDHVMVVVTLKAEGLWGSDNMISQDAGAGEPFEGVVNRAWAVGINEAYVQMNQAFYSPATVKLGRQYLNYGRGLILSSNEGEYNFDAARLVLDYYPLTIDLVGASLVNDQSFQSVGNSEGAADLLFANARYELTDSLLKDIEVYAGWIAQHPRGPISSGSPFYTPIFAAASPWIIGVRGDLNITKNLTTWFEGAYEGGADGYFDGNIEAFLLNIGGKFTFADVKMTPVINAGYTYASGGGKNEGGYFRPWFDYTEGYNGYMLKPALSNIQIFNLGASIKPANNCTLGVQGYYYMMANPNGVVFQNPNIDVSYGYVAGYRREVGWGVDTTLGYDYSKDVRLQLVYGMFIPAHGDSTPVNPVAHGVRAELNVKF